MQEEIAQLAEEATQFIDKWAGNILFITAASLVAWLVWCVVYNRLYALTEKTKIRWDDLTLEALRTPITLLIWGWPGIISLGFLLEGYFNTKVDWLSTLKMILILGVCLWFMLRLVSNIEEYVIEQQKRDETTVQAISKIVRLFFTVIAAMTVMQSFGVSLSGLLTFSGVGGLIVGFAAKDLLSNFFGGMIVHLERPFKVGDWVRSPDRNIEGTVERIGWRMTIIRTFDKRPLYVPNSVFNNIVVENPSRMLNRRIYENVGIRYEDSQVLADIVSDIKEMLQNHDDIDTKQTLIVNFNAFGPSSLDMMVYTFTKTVNWIRYHEVKQDVLLQIMGIIEKHKASIAYPTQTIHMAPQHAGMEYSQSEDNSSSTSENKSEEQGQQ
ncbi:mechanosensitive ion channel family protein [Vibrio sp. AK197]